MSDAQKSKNDWLSDYGKDFFSQRGEDGILEKVFEIIGDGSRWCVEFGAWDGKHLSNTHYLMAEKGWSGVFVEADNERYKELLETYKNNKNAICVNAFVNFTGDFALDAILERTKTPKNFDLLSIDIDGNDYHVWESLKAFTPRVVIIEFNPTIPPDIEFVQPRDMRVNQGSSIASFVALAKIKGYELVAATELNAIFVRRELFHLFGISNNRPEEILRVKRKYTQLFYLYDGTIVLRGDDIVSWHGVHIKTTQLQVVPKFFRSFPERMGVIKNFLFKIWRKIHNSL